MAAQPRCLTYIWRLIEIDHAPQRGHRLSRHWLREGAAVPVEEMRQAADLDVLGSCAYLISGSGTSVPNRAVAPARARVRIDLACANLSAATFATRSTTLRRRVAEKVKQI